MIAWENRLKGIVRHIKNKPRSFEIQAVAIYLAAVFLICGVTVSGLCQTMFFQAYWEGDLK